MPRGNVESVRSNFSNDSTFKSRPFFFAAAVKVATVDKRVGRTRTAENASGKRHVL
jgi:hypothetical protein